ncbi:MAG: hypothetical protein ACH0QD_00825, partial [Tepidibacillus sp.]
VHNVVLYYWIWTGITCTSIVKDFFVVWTIFEDCYYFESSDLINATLVDLPESGIIFEGDRVALSSIYVN